MKRVAKPEGQYNIVIEKVGTPSISSTQVLVKAQRSLISRGSEIWGRYVRSEAVDPRAMGYSLAGEVVAVGDNVAGLAVGDRVAASAPHAEFAAVEATGPIHAPRVVKLPEEIPVEAATFWPLTTSSVLWMAESGIRSGQTMVILGQGLVGSCCMQVAKATYGARVIAVDSLPLRCGLAAELGADDVVDASEEDPVEAVRRLTNDEGADVVVEAVGGRAAPTAFEQAQEMVRRGGLLQVLGLHGKDPLPLNAARIQGRRLIGGYMDTLNRWEGSARTLDHLSRGTVAAARMITHRFPFAEASAAFDLLYKRLGETLGVILVWEE